MDLGTRSKESQKVTVVGALIDFILSILKIVLGIIGQSSALVADGVHSFSDLLTDWVTCLLYTSPSPRDRSLSRMPSSA